MRWVLGKITKQSQVQTIPPPLDATYLAVAMKLAGSTRGTRSVRMSLGSEEHYRVRAWQVHRFSGTPNLGFFRPRLAPYGLRKPTLGSFDRFGRRAAELRPPSSGVVWLHTCAYNASRILAGGHQADCYKLLLSCILASIPDRAYWPRLREAKSRVLLKRVAQEAEEISL
jgi:hypothetical protein